MGEPYAYIDDEFKKASEAKISILEPLLIKVTPFMIQCQF